MEKPFLKGPCIVNIKRHGVGLGDMLALTPLFREIKKQNPKAYTVLTTSDERLEPIRTLMKGQPFPDMIIGNYPNDIEKGNLPYYDFVITDINYDYEQMVKPNVVKSRSRVNMDFVGIKGSSKPYYRILNEDMLWLEQTIIKRKLDKYPIIVQFNGREPYKGCDCDKEMLLSYCKALNKINNVLVISDLNENIFKGHRYIKFIVPPDIRKAIALTTISSAMVGFDSVFIQSSAAFDIPYLELSGPTYCSGRIADGKYIDQVRSHMECEPCFRDSNPTCRLTGEHHKSACIYNIPANEIIDKLQRLIDRKTSIITYIRQSEHNDRNYVDKLQKDRVSWLVKHATTREGVLEVGCANGYIVDKMAPPDKGYRHCGIDIDGNRIRLAKQTKSKKIDFYCLDAQFGLPFNSNSFSTVVLAEFLEHIDFEEAKEAVEEAYRVAKDKILITCPFFDEDYLDDPERAAMVDNPSHKIKVGVDTISKLLNGYKYTYETTKFIMIEIIKNA